MYRASSLRSAAVAMTLAVAMSLPVTFAHAAGTKPFNPVAEGCKGAGYDWSDERGCANKPCKNWQFGTGTPGATAKQIMPDKTSGLTYGMCNGFTGQWEPLPQ
jgi:hypothetical protein